MSIWFSHRWRLHKLNREQKKLDEDGERHFRESHAKNDSSIIENWLSDNTRQFRHLEYARTEMVSELLLKEADQLYLPRPPYDEKERWVTWEPEPDEIPNTMARPVLSALGMTELRQAIRKERRERSERAEFWLKIVGGVIGILTGLVGALIGLFSVLNRR